MNLLNLTPTDARRVVADWVAQHGEPPYRTRQIVPRLWQRPVPSWGAASDLPRTLIEQLERDARIPRLVEVTRRLSSDGTVKLLWRLPDGLTVESVWIPEGRRITLCISSQVGCAYACAFCATGRMGFERHLEAWEIAGQVREVGLDPDLGAPTNIVFMGMGEPLHNWPAVDRALTILNAKDGLGIGARRITVSTIGLVPKLAQLAERKEQFRLAVSLHAPTTEQRAELMPVERKYPLSELLPSLDAFAKRITFEYVMIQGMNDSLADAAKLATLARPLGAMVNLLPLHPGGADHLRATPATGITRFAAALRNAGVQVTVRRSRGLDIRAACGQLRVEVEQPRRVRTEDHSDVQQKLGSGRGRDATQSEQSAHGASVRRVSPSDQNAR
jgi:23S rRNA (adenine2503-C2)-methyltransferase